VPLFSPVKEWSPWLHYFGVSSLKVRAASSRFFLSFLFTLPFPFFFPHPHYFPQSNVSMASSLTSLDFSLASFVLLSAPFFFSLPSWVCWNGTGAWCPSCCPLAGQVKTVSGYRIFLSFLPFLCCVVLDPLPHFDLIEGFCPVV